jgi:alkanesulfonate monooxygenase SsuD/methylene tetrahydromethanopterin reductase-like flavin-dependent oxidoreductase (luciferase family)
MQAWHFSETAYPYLPPQDSYPSIRVSLPNQNYDPVKGAALWDSYLKEWQIADEEGMEVMLNEHHQTATCVDPAAPLVLATLARLTTRARLLILGNPIANRRQPVRVAEEMAMCDVLSKGRIEAGFVRGVPYEISPANSNPVRMGDRFWEALDLIVKTWTSHDGPFSHEGRFFHHRNVNIWPRAYQNPHPPVWVSTTSTGGAAEVGAKGFVQATFLTGFEATRKIFDSYRGAWRKAGRGNDVPNHRLAYAALVYVGETEKEAHEGAEKLLWYVTANKVAPQYANPPGYVPVAANVAMMRGAEHPLSAFAKGASVEAAIRSGFMFAGTPDQVYNQIKRHYEYVGGYGHLLNMGQAGFLEHEDSVKGIRNFARHVYPRLREDFPNTRISGQYGDVPPEPPEAHVLRSATKAATGPLYSQLGGGAA